MQWEITFKKTLNNLFHSKGDGTLYLIFNLQPCERIWSFYKSLIPFKNLRWRERIGKRNFVPQRKDPSGSAWECNTWSPTSAPWPSAKVTRGHHAAPHRSGTPQVIKKGNNGVKVIKWYGEKGLSPLLISRGLEWVFFLFSYKLLKFLMCTFIGAKIWQWILYSWSVHPFFPYDKLLYLLPGWYNINSFSFLVSNCVLVVNFLI